MLRVKHESLILSDVVVELELPPWFKLETVLETITFGFEPKDAEAEEPVFINVGADESKLVKVLTGIEVILAPV